MEKKLIILLFFCAAALLVWVSSGFSWTVYDNGVDDPGCDACHGEGFAALQNHATHSAFDCTSCHAEDPPESPATSNCIACHPLGDTGVCPLATGHDAPPESETSCLSCHVPLSECDPLPECETDDDCADGEVCEEEVCVVAPGCETDDDCADGEVCEEEVCVPSVGQPCSETSDCAEGEVCEEGECVVAPGCETDDDCAEGEVCEEGECVVAPGCETDDDCAEGEVCEEEVCVPSVGQECSETSDCAEGEVCEEGVCVAPGCETAADCDDADLCTTDECTAGECVNTDVDCLDDVCDPADGECVECLIADDCEDDETCTLNMCVPASGLCSLDKVTLKAGKKDFTDSIELKGKQNAAFVELLESVGSDITVTLEGADDLIPDPNQTTYPFEVTEASLNTNKQKYTSPKQDKSVEPQTSFTLETKNNTMKLSVKKADLTGLKCPITFMLDFGGFSCMAEADELVNGNKDCPRSLMMGVENYLDASTLVKLKQSSKVDSDTLDLKGEFTVDGFDGSFNLSQPVVIMFGDNTYTVPGSDFKEKNGKYSCKNAESESDTGLVTATFDTVKATYSIKVKKATVLTGGGVVAYSIDLFGFLIEAGDPVPVNPISAF